MGPDEGRRIPEWVYAIWNAIAYRRPQNVDQRDGREELEPRFPLRLYCWIRNPEVIGAADCPIILRWTIIDAKPPTVSPSSNPEGQSNGRPGSLILLPKKLTRDRKLMLHRFLPNVEDRDPHDHPRGFWTFVLWGGYFDLVPCDRCGGEGRYVPNRGIAGIPEHGDYPKMVEPIFCGTCKGTGLVVGDRMKPGTLRYRPAEHRHVTQSSADGAWTLVVMGPLERPWGFWRGVKWWPWKDYEEEFGFSMRCPSEEEREGRMLKYADGGEVIYKAAPVGFSAALVERAIDPIENTKAAFKISENRGGREEIPNAAPRTGGGRTSLTLQEAREQDRERLERKDKG